MCVFDDAGDGSAGSTVERRIARDGKAYTWPEFLDYYGDQAWRQAAVAAAAEDINVPNKRLRKTTTTRGQSLQQGVQSVWVLLGL